MGALGARDAMQDAGWILPVPSSWASPYHAQKRVHVVSPAYSRQDFARGLLAWDPPGVRVGERRGGSGAAAAESPAHTAAARGARGDGLAPARHCPQAHQAACQIRLSVVAAVGLAAKRRRREAGGVERKEKFPLSSGSGRAARVRPVDYTLISGPFVPVLRGTLRGQSGPVQRCEEDRGGTGSGSCSSGIRA